MKGGARSYAKATEAWRAAAALACAGCALLFALRVPTGAGPDEPAHLDLARAVRESGALPDPRDPRFLQAQHPPLTPVLNALWMEALDHAGLDQGVRSDPAGGSRPPEEAWWWRMPGVGAALLTAWLLIGAARRVAGTGGALAGMAVVLLPGFWGPFATVGNDGLATLLATGGIALVLRGATWGCGLLFGLAFLTKLTVVGPWLFAFLLTAGAARARQRVALVAGPALIAGWWAVRQLVLTGSLNAVEVSARHHAGLFRAATPQAYEAAEIVGGWLWTGPGTLASPMTTPGGAWSILFAPFLMLLLLGTVAAMQRRDERGRRARALAAASALLAAALLLGNRWFFYVHGRYFLVLALPFALGWAQAAEVVAPRASRGACAALLAVALGGAVAVAGGSLAR